MPYNLFWHAGWGWLVGGAGILQRPWDGAPACFPLETLGGAPGERLLVAEVDQELFTWMRSIGFRVEVDPALTRPDSTTRRTDTDQVKRHARVFPLHRHGFEETYLTA